MAIITGAHNNWQYAMYSASPNSCICVIDNTKLYRIIDTSAFEQWLTKKNTKKTE